MTSCRVRREFARTLVAALKSLAPSRKQPKSLQSQLTGSPENHRRQRSEMRRAGSSHGRADRNAPRQHQPNAG
jgi:hypothetical protein